MAQVVIQERRTQRAWLLAVYLVPLFCRRSVAWAVMWHGWWEGEVRGKRKWQIYRLEEAIAPSLVIALWMPQAAGGAVACVLQLERSR